MELRRNAKKCEIYLWITADEHIIFPCRLIMNDVIDYEKTKCLVDNMRRGMLIEESEIGMWAERHGIGGFQMIYPLSYGLNLTLIAEYVRQKIYYYKMKKGLG